MMADSHAGKPGLGKVLIGEPLKHIYKINTIDTRYREHCK